LALSGAIPAHIAFAEGLRSALLRLYGVAIGEPVHHGDSKAGDRPHPHADGAASDDQKPVLKCIFNTGESSLELLLLHIGDARAFDDQIDDLGNGKDTQSDGHQRNTVPEIKLAEGPAQASRLRIDADHAHCQSHGPGNQSFDGRSSAEYRHHRDAQNSHHEKLRRTERKNQRSKHRHGKGEHKRAEETAQHRRHVSRAESSAGFAPARHGISSRIVACDPVVPGTANSTDGIVSEVVVTASNPIMIASASNASIV
jgi:hypothetical protein